MESTQALRKALAAQRRTNLKPPPKLTVSEWADEYRRLSPEASAEPGRWFTARAEYQRGIMDAVSDPAVETVVVMSSAQVGKTEIVNNIVGYHVHQDPAPILVLQPTVEMAQTWSKDRLAPMLRDTPALRGRVKAPRSKNSQNTLLHKVFPGGHITMTGSNAPASLASRPIRIVLCDEVDRYPPSAGTEGDPVSLARKRSTTFWNRKIILTSTPTAAGMSRIEAEFEQSDKRHFHVPCPHCGTRQRMLWGNVKWLQDDAGQHLPDTAAYHCGECGVVWSEADRQAAIRQGRWVATGQPGRIAGFHLSELYSPWSSIPDMARAFLSAKKNTETLRTFINTALGEPWEDRGEQVDQHGLYGRREKYAADVPNGALLLTAGIDVQRDRIEMEVVGWGEGEESWNVDYRVIPGDPARDDVWQDLENALHADYQHETGTQMHITAAVIDSGDQTTRVYDFVQKSKHQRLFAGKGVPGPGRPVAKVSRATSGKKRRQVDLYQIGVDDAKGTIYARLKMTETGPGFCHFPLSRDAEYFAQLTSEKLITRYRLGRPHKEWHKVRARNEALDCRVYAFAALKLLNPVWSAISRNLDKKANPEKPPEPELPRTTQRRRPQRRRRNWATDLG
jgi:phage terminase large subunit GpA-like protein